MRMTVRKITVSCLLLMLVGTFSVALANSELKQLKYRELFYHFYNKDMFSAIARLNALQDLGVLGRNNESLDLLLGSMYGSYRLYDEADDLLSTIATRSKSSSNRNLAWFYLGKTYLEREKQATAEKLFLKIDQMPKPALQDELMYRRLDIRLDSGQLTQSDDLYDEISKRSLWKKYAQFNLGAALIKSGDSKQGVRLISRIGAQDLEGEEMLSLRDKANVVLGYLFLREEQYEKAREYFERVRLDGSLSRKAMLGLGWAYSREDKYQMAMVPWKKLSEESAHDLIVQEAMLAMGYAYSQLDADRQALKQYESSIKTYEAVQSRINNAVFEVKNGRVTSLLFSDQNFDDASITKQLMSILRKDDSHVIVDMLKEKEFQEAFSGYRELKSLQGHLEKWRQDLRKYEQQQIKDVGSFGKSASGMNVSALKNRVNNMDLRLGMLLSNYELRMQKKMIEYLEKQQRYVAHYLSQTKFAIAQLIDVSSKGPVQ